MRALLHSSPPPLIEWTQTISPSPHPGARCAHRSSRVTQCQAAEVGQHVPESPRVGTSACTRRLDRYAKAHRTDPTASRQDVGISEVADASRRVVPVDHRHDPLGARCLD